MRIDQKHTGIREEAASYMYQETLAAGIARGRHEEHQRACKMIRRVLVEIVNARFPLIAAFVQEHIERMDSFTVLHQCAFVISTSWTAEDVLRFLLALDEAQHPPL